MAWLETRLPPPLVMLLVGVGMALAVPQAAGPGLATRRAAAAVLVVAGLAVAVAGLLEFRRARTTFNPMTPSRAAALVTTGIYRFTRNPMYVGDVLLLVAWALLLSSWAALAGPVLFVLYMNRFQIGPEERVLAGRFGDDYERYRRRVRRWV